MKSEKTIKERLTAAKMDWCLYLKLWLMVGVFFCLAGAAPAYAITTISQGYTITGNAPEGSIVSLQKNSSDSVNLATSTNSDSIIGVVISSSNSLISLTNGSTNQVQVATNGVVDVLVSDINGGIVAGDEITASPIAGVGMNATDNTKVVGVAQDSLDNSNSSQEDYTDSQKKTHKIRVGNIPVLVSISYFYKQPNKTLIPAAVQNIANTLAGKPVDTVPILISIGIFLITLIIITSMVYSMIHSSIISVGRNPMSQSAIYRDLLQMSVLVMGIIIVAVILIYLILTRF